MSAADELANYLRQTIASTPYGGGELVLTPWELPGHESIELRVHPIAEDFYYVSDRGMIADALIEYGVDVSSRSSRKSWDAVRGELAPVVGIESQGYEIATTATGQDLGEALSDVSACALRAFELRALGATFRPRRFSDIVMKQIQEHGLTVQPRPALQTKFGKREAHLKAVNEGAHRESFIMALRPSRSYANAEFDHTYSIFSSAKVPIHQRAVVLSEGAPFKAEQIAGLREVCAVVAAGELDDYLVDLAA